MVMCINFKFGSNYIPSMQQKVKDVVHLKVNSNQDNGPQKQDLRQWMNDKEKNYQKDKERIQQICKKLFM